MLQRDARNRIRGQRPLRPPNLDTGGDSVARTYREPPGERERGGGGGGRARPSARVRCLLWPSASLVRGPVSGSGSRSPPLSPARAGLGRRLSLSERRAPPLVLPGPRRPLPLVSARGAWPQRAQLPRPPPHASRAQRLRRQPSLRRFLRSGDGGQDLQASKDREEKSHRSVTRLIPKA